MIRFFILVIILFSFSNSISLSKEEKIFLKNHPKIILGGDENWAPYVHLTDKNTVEGYDKDILEKINKRTGANFQIKAGTWNKLLEDAKNKKIDGLTTSVAHKEREKYFNFSHEFTSHSMYVVVKHGNPLSINKEKDLENRTIVIQKGDLFLKKLSKKFPKSKIIYRDTLEEVFYEVIYGNADATINEAPIEHLENEKGLPYLNIAFLLKERAHIVFSVRKDWPEAISILNKGLQSISNVDKEELKNKWLKKFTFNYKRNILDLTKEEKNYILKKKKLTVCADPTWSSFTKSNLKEDKKNLTLGFLDFVLKKTGLEKELVYTKTWEESLLFIKEKKCDIISVIQKNKERAKYINFTSPYVYYPLMVITHKDTPYLFDLNLINSKTIAILNKHAGIELFNNKYKNSKISYVDDGVEGLKKVHNGEIFGYVDLLPSLSPIFSKFKDLKINRELNFGLSLSMGIRNDDFVLHNILEKTIMSISAFEKNKIFNKLIDVRYEENINTELIIKLLAILIVIILIVIYSNIQLNKKINEAVVKNKEQESLIFYYAKQESMRDLIGNISHQWKQPINEISAMLMHIETKIMLKQPIEQELIEYTTKRCRKIIDFKSETIDTFNNFYSIQHFNEQINITNVLKDIVFMIKGSMERNQIIIDINCEKKDIYIYGRANELKQVILAIINNAQDIFIERNTINPKIVVTVYEENDSVIIEILDNAGGIYTNFMDKIFDISFSKSKKGTGIGLYISKVIIKEKFNGLIEAKNTKQGALFKIEIPNYKEF